MSEWRQIPSFRGYEVNRRGEVRRKAGGRGARPGRIVKPQVNRTNGYAYVNLWSGSRRRAVRLHRVVAEAFLGDVQGREVNHLNGDRLDNRVVNLEIVTSSENVRHSYRRLGRRPAVYGERHHKAKLTADDVREIRRVWPVWRALGRTQAELGARYGVADSRISRIVNHKAWRHVQ